MRINDGSICSECDYFEHECNWGDDFSCRETCYAEDGDVREKFYDDEEEILECKYFKE